MSTNASKDKRSNPQKQSQVARARGTQYKVFSQPQKTEPLQKNVTKLKINDKEYTSNQFEILSEERKFYETFYKSQRSAILTRPNETFFETENVTSSNEEKLSCERIVSEDECLRALKELSPLALTVFLWSFTNFFGQKSVLI